MMVLNKEMLNHCL